MNARTCKATLVLILLVRLVLTPVQAAKVNQIGSDAEFESLWNQVTELKNPSTRVLLRLRLLNSPAKKTIPAATFLEVLSDLCVNQDEIDPIASSWLYTGLLDVLKRKQPSDPKTIEVCQLKNWEQQRSARALNDGIRMLSDPQTIKEGTQLAKEALLSREISA